MRKSTVAASRRYGITASDPCHGAANPVSTVRSRPLGTRLWSQLDLRAMVNRHAWLGAVVRSEDARPRVWYAQVVTWSQIDSAGRGTAPEGQAIPAL